MSRGRRKLVDPTIRKRINVPETIASRVDVILIDPLTGSLRYNAWSDYVNKLIRDDLEKGSQSELVSLILSK